MSYSFRPIKKGDLDTCAGWLQPLLKEPRLKQNLLMHLKNGVALGLLDEGRLIGCAFWYYTKEGVSLSYFYIAAPYRKRPIVLRFLGVVVGFCENRAIFFKSRNVWEFKRMAIPLKGGIYRLEIPKRALERWGQWVAA